MTLANLIKNPHAHMAGIVGLAIIGALASRYAVPFAFRYSMGFLPLAVAVLLFLLYRARLPQVLRASRKSLRLAITCGVTALLFSTFLVIGSWSICEDSGPLTWLHLLAIIANAFPLWALLVLLMGWLDNVAARTQRRAQAPNAFHLTRKGCLIVFAVLLLCWLPVFLAAFPGFFCYDMNSQPTNEYSQFVSGRFLADYPTLHVLLLGHLVTLGETIGGTMNAGVALYVSVQVIIVSLIFTFTVRQIAEASASKLLTIGSTAYLALDPMVSLFVVCTTRDTLFSAFAVLFAVQLFMLFKDRSTPRAGSLVALGASALAVCFLRPNGITAIIVLMPFLIFFVKGARARLCMGGMCAAVLMACWLWFGPAATALGVQPAITTRLLVFSLPAQQITKVVESGTYRISDVDMLVENGFGTVNKEGNRAMYERFPQLADSARGNLLYMSDEDVIKAYLTLGFAYPMEYLEAFIDLTQAAWNPYAYAAVYDPMKEGSPYEERATSLFEFHWEDPVSSETLAPGLFSVLEDISGQLTLQNVPLLSLLVAVPFYLWLFILMLARTIVTLDKRIAAPCIFLAVLTITVFFGPAVLMRYYLPLIFGLPLMMACFCCASSNAYSHEGDASHDAHPGRPFAQAAGQISDGNGDGR